MPTAASTSDAAATSPDEREASGRAEPGEQRSDVPGHEQGERGARQQQRADLPGLPAVADQDRGDADELGEPRRRHRSRRHRAADDGLVAHDVEREEAVGAPAYPQGHQRYADQHEQEAGPGDQPPGGRGLEQEDHPGRGRRHQHGAEHVEPGAASRRR